MEDKAATIQEDIVARSREVSEEQWSTIRAELEDSEDTAHLAFESCSQLSGADD